MGFALERIRRFTTSSKWPVFKRPSLAGFERPLTLGNWDSLTTDGGSAQTRGHNKQNEITSISWRIDADF